MNKRITAIILTTLMILCFAAARANAGMPVAAFGCWPDTGQDRCYTGGNIGYETGIISCPAEGEAYYGQDAQYDIHSPSYTKLDDTGSDLSDTATVWSMVRDNVTGLVWEVKTDDDSIHDKDNTFTWCDSNPDTNGGNAGTCGDGTDSEDFIRSLNDANFGGHDDWRMPTVEELSTLLNAHRQNPSIDVNYFPHTITASSYWTATSATHYSVPNGGDGAQAWVINFYFGNVNSDYSIVKSDSLSVRAVRGGTTRLIDHLVDNGDGTVTDSNTCLVWQQVSADIDNDGVADKMTWADALVYAEGLTLGGHDDWRLPSSAELQTLVDYGKAVPAVDTNYFPDTDSSSDYSRSYWTSTTTPNLGSGGVSAHNAKVVSFAYGRVEAGVKSGTHYVRVVRSAPCSCTDHLLISAHLPVSGYALITSVTINGKSFGAEPAGGGVSFGGVAAAITFWTDTEIVCVAPAHGPGKVALTVTGDTGDQASTSFVYYDPGAAILEAGALPDSGQDKCYNASSELTPCPVEGEPFYGQDAQYTINPPSYTKLDADGSELPDSATDWVMVRDNVTGLVWEVKSSDSASIHANRALPWCNTNPATNGGDTGCCDGYGYNTEDFIQDLNNAGFGGHNDWRLPSMADLATLMSHGQYYAFDPAYFPNMNNRYWSATTYSDYPSNAWYISATGAAGYAGKIGYSYQCVIAVRGGVPRIVNRFIDNGNGTVTDTKTCLTWQKETLDFNNDGNLDANDKTTWEQALAAAESLELGGHDDWRLPNRKELQAIMDYSRPGFFMDTNFFPEFANPYYWSSTTAGFSSQSWMVSFNQYYGVYASSKSSSFYYVRAVRTAQCQAVISSLVPDSGYSANPVVIHGSGFGDSQGTGSVTFAALPANIISWSDTEITCAPPAHAVGEVAVRVTNFAGNLATTSFTYLNAPPVIDAGESVTVTMSEDSDPTPFSLTLEATDADGDQLTWSIAGQAVHGSALLSANGNSVQPSYNPVTNYHGQDSFTCQVNDGQGGMDAIVVNVDVVNAAVQNEIDQAVDEAVAAAQQSCDQEVANREQIITERDTTILYLQLGDFDLDGDVDGEDLAGFSTNVGKTEIDVDNDVDGYAEIDGDCDDGNADANPAVDEICADGIDNNCNGLVDEEGCYQ